MTVLEAGPGSWESGIAALTSDGLHLPIGRASPVVRRYRSLLTNNPSRSAELVRGCTVGGSGAINGGYFCRALPADFELSALPGWSWREVEAHYRAVEEVINVRVVGELTGISKTFAESAVAAGFRWLPDLNAVPFDGNVPPGVGAVPLNIIDGIRIGPGTAFLDAAAVRPNLTVVTHTRATRVRMAGSKAVGVEALGVGGRVRLDADRVVLSAGAIESARLLMQSGIGPARALRLVGVDVVVDLPVGQACWDHPEWVIPADWSFPELRPVLEVVLVNDDIEIRPYTRGFTAMAGREGSDQGDRSHVGVALMRPRSRGRVSLVSADLSVPPRIEHRYDSSPQDVAALQNGYELVEGILRATTGLGQPAWSTSQHFCGTARMGADADEHAVVGPECRVRGVDGLWVVDGSVLPRPTGRGPHATIAMLGHRAAEFVR